MSGTNSTTDAEELEFLYSQLRLSISAKRVERRAGRSHAIWDDEFSLVQVVRKEGKFETFGSYIGNKLYLEYYEALYLLELGRLQLDKDGITLSIEQAYLLLLGELPTPKFNEYLVYSYLSRAGYILVRHRNKFFCQTFMQSPNQTDCIFAWLANAVQNRAVPNYIKKTAMYAKTKQQMEAIKLSIMQPQHDSNTNETKETIEEVCPEKKPKLDNDEQLRQSEQQKQELWPVNKETSFLDFLMTESEFKEFEKMFKKFDIIKLKSSKCMNDDDSSECSDDNDAVENVSSRRNFSINFDLYLHNIGFKKSLPMPPLMRVLIVDSKQSFPNHAEISRCCQHLYHATPLLVVSVGDAKQIQAFLYLFT